MSLALRTPVQVFAGEHYCAPVHYWTCSAAPITDPATHQVLGVIDLTGFREFHHPHSLAVVQSIARAIEDGLRDSLELDRFTIFGDYLELMTRHPDTLLIALDRGQQVIRCSSAVWDQGWIDAQNRLRHMPAGESHAQDGASWEVQGGRGGTWTWISHHCYRQHRRIGTIIQAVPASSRGNGGASGKSRNLAEPRRVAMFDDLLGDSPNFRQAVAEGHVAAGSDAPVLLLGETGTGKELMAEAIHNASHFAAGSFVAVNCGAIPHELIGTELFGFEGGSFTGAAREGRAGKFELANRGTIFLDEIGELPLELQPYLLRVLDSGDMTRIGGQSPIRLHLRVISATNQNLEAMVEAGSFRRDLFYRLNVLRIVLLPVRERPGDAVNIFQSMLMRLAQKSGRSSPTLSAPVAALIERYPWPGNVREIRNVAERVIAEHSATVLTVSDLPPIFQQLAHSDIPAKTSEELALKHLEMDWMLQVLDECQGNVSMAAKRLGIHRSTLYRKLSQRKPSRSVP